MILLALSLLIPTLAPPRAAVVRPRRAPPARACDDAFDNLRSPPTDAESAALATAMPTPKVATRAARWPSILGFFDVSSNELQSFTSSRRVIVNARPQRRPVAKSDSART